MSDIDPKKLKVAELREELKARGLDAKGNKPQLVKRLIDALAAEAGSEPLDESVGDLDTTTEDLVESSQPEADNGPEPAAEPEPEPVAEPEPQEAYEEAQPEPEPEPEPEPQEEAAPEAEQEPEQEEPQQEEQPMEDEESAPEAQQAGAEDAEVAQSMEQGEPEADQAAKPAEQEGEQRGEKRRHTDDQGQHQHRRHRSRSPLPKNAVMESDDWLNTENVELDRYNCDLNIRISDDGIKANPITVEGFAFMWAGARAMYGVNQGKICYEMKVLENLNVDHLPAEESNRHVVRVGFSTNDTTMQLGEEKNSWGYGGTGKISVDCKFEDYGQKFDEGDVIGAYLDLESEPAEISYTKNGEDLGKAFEVAKAALEGAAIFPHVLTKNSEFELNFGAREEPYFPIKEGFTLIGQIEPELRVRGSAPPEKKEDCEMIMMCGLPGAGKTYWAEKHAAEQPEKKFNVLGTNNIIDKMRVMGLPRKRNYEGRWDTLIDKANKCLTRLFEIAAKKKRNYILDQTNVYPSAQRRKMRPFDGFQRRAIVIVPTDEEFKKRCEKREKEEGKDVPDSAVLEMKAHFQLPEDGNIFDKIEFTELDREEAQKLVETYNKDAREQLPPPEKRFHDGRDRYGGGRDFRGGYGGGYRDRGGRGGGYGNYRGGGGGGYGGYDRRGGNRGGYNQRGGGGYMGYNNRDRDRMQGRRDHHRDDRRSGGRGHDNRSGGSRSYDSQWKGHGSWGGNQGSWGNQGGWGGQQSGSWGNQGSWGSNQGYGNQGWGQQGQNWGQNYNYGNQGNWGSWGSGYGNQQQQQQGQSGSWGSYGNYGNYNQGGTQQRKQ